MLQLGQLRWPATQTLRKHLGLIEATCVLATSLRHRDSVQLSSLAIGATLTLWTLARPTGARAPSRDAESADTDAPASPLETHASALSLALVAHEDKVRLPSEPD